MKCEKYQEELSLYIDRELSDKQMEEIQKHIESCQDCRDEVRDLSSLIKEMKEIQLKPLPTHFKQALHERLLQEQKLHKDGKAEELKSFKRLFKYKKQILMTVAASIALILTFPIFYKNIGRNQDKFMESTADNVVNREMVQTAPQENIQMDQNLEKIPEQQDLYSLKKQSESLPEQKIIKRAYIQLEVNSLEHKQSQIEEIIKKYNGYAESSNLVSLGDRSSASSKEGHVVLKTPVEHYESALREIKSIGKINNINESSEDVTRQYVDIEARMRTLEVQEQRVIEIMKNASKVEELIQLEARLGEIRAQIESYKTELQNMDRLATYSTIEVHLIEVSKLQQMQGVDQNLGERMKGKFVDSLYNFKSILERGILWISGFIVPAAFFTLLFAIFYNIYKVIRKKNRQ